MLQFTIAQQGYTYYIYKAKFKRYAHKLYETPPMHIGVHMYMYYIQLRLRYGNNLKEQ